MVIYLQKYLCDDVIAIIDDYLIGDKQYWKKKYYDHLQNTFFIMSNTYRSIKYFEKKYKKYNKSIFPNNLDRYYYDYNYFNFKQFVCLKKQTIQKLIFNSNLQKEKKEQFFRRYQTLLNHSNIRYEVYGFY